MRLHDPSRLKKIDLCGQCLLEMFDSGHMTPQLASWMLRDETSFKVLCLIFGEWLMENEPNPEEVLMLRELASGDIQDEFAATVRGFARDFEPEFEAAVPVILAVKAGSDERKRQKNAERQRRWRQRHKAGAAKDTVPA